jgi:hypothetical protein
LFGYRDPADFAESDGKQQLIVVLNTIPGKPGYLTRWDALLKKIAATNIPTFAVVHDNGPVCQFTPEFFALPSVQVVSLTEHGRQNLTKFPQIQVRCSRPVVAMVPVFRALKQSPIPEAAEWGNGYVFLGGRILLDCRDYIAIMRWLCLFLKRNNVRLVIAGWVFKADDVHKIHQAIIELELSNYVTIIENPSAVLFAALQQHSLFTVVEANKRNIKYTTVGLTATLTWSIGANTPILADNRYRDCYASLSTAFVNDIRYPENIDHLDLEQLAPALQACAQRIPELYASVLAQNVTTLRHVLED